MSCRTTKGGTVALRLARLYSGLSDKRVQKLFHALLREGEGLSNPTQSDFKEWTLRQRALIRHANITDAQKTRSERDLFLAQSEYPSGSVFHAWSKIELRARQEAVLDEITTAVDLQPPGSQIDEYKLDENGQPANVWYASYGSNMSKDRFLTYIKGGSPEGTSVIHLGARDEADPTGDIPIRYDGRMHFAYVSSRWANGGVAFMDNDHAGHALGRAYRITNEQFEDVVSQENGRGWTRDATKKIDLGEIITSGKPTQLNTSLYGTIIHIGDYDNAPVFTFTSSFTSQEALLEADKWYTDPKTADISVAANSPSGNYLRMIGTGLKESFGMTDEQAADYLRGCSGAEDWTRRELLATLRAPEPTPPPKPTYTFGTGSTYRPIPSEKPPFSSGPKYGVSTSGNVRSIAKLCPICGKQGHTMHECPLLSHADSKETDAASQKARGTNPVKQETVVNALTTLGLSHMNPSTRITTMLNRWTITPDRGEHAASKEGPTWRFTRFDGKSLRITITKNGIMYSGQRKEYETLREDAYDAFEGATTYTDEFVRLVTYLEASRKPAKTKTPPKGKKGAAEKTLPPHPAPEDEETVRMAMHAMRLENTPLSETALQEFADWRYEVLDEVEGEEAWAARLTHYTGHTVKVTLGDKASYIYNGADEALEALRDSAKTTMPVTLYDPTDDFIEVLEQLELAN